MSTAIKDSRNTAAGSGVPQKTSSAVTKNSAIAPDLEIRFSPLYAWLIMGFGLLFFFIGLLFVSPSARGRNVGLGLFICAASIAAVVGGNYWRHHLPIMVRMTPRQLFLPRGVTVEWAEITAIEKKTIPLRRQSSEWICIKLKNKLPARNFSEKFGLRLKSLLTGGYDIVISPQQELMRDADWFIAECKKRMPSGPANPTSSS
jgi:hypothetical protein